MRAPVLLVSAALLLAPHAARASCVIHHPKPTGWLPTSGPGEVFSFGTFGDCVSLRFTTEGSSRSRVPTVAPDPGPMGNTMYQVVLTEREWSYLTSGSDTFAWSITGRSGTGETTSVTTVNQIARDARSLATADAILIGEDPADFVGYSVSSAGDVDGDGRDDVLVGAYHHDSQRGVAYLVMGPIHGTMDLSAADATLVGEATGDFAGQSVSSAGDANGDGHVDLLIGARQNDEGGRNAGAAYLVNGPVSGTVDLSAAAAKFIGGAGDWAGAVSGAGDVDDDGFDDLLVGAPSDDEAGLDAGAAYLVLGPATGSHDLSLADATLLGGRGGGAGTSLAGVGDVDGDGHDDILVGAYLDSDGGSYAGAAYLVQGPILGTLDLSGADATLVGEAPGDWAGLSVSGGGDVDGDGLADLLIGACGNDDGGSLAGAAYVVRGTVTGTVELSTADAELVGRAGDNAACSVSGAGDVDGDGHRDVLVGAYAADAVGNDAGAAYVVRGPFSATMELSLADATLTGEKSADWAGISVSSAGDVDDDGLDDVLIGAYSAGSSRSGVAYLLYGSGL